MARQDPNPVQNPVPAEDPPTPDGPTIVGHDTRIVEGSKEADELKARQLQALEDQKNVEDQPASVPQPPITAPGGATPSPSPDSVRGDDTL